MVGIFPAFPVNISKNFKLQNPLAIPSSRPDKENIKFHYVGIGITAQNIYCNSVFQSLSHGVENTRHLCFLT